MSGVLVAQGPPWSARIIACPWTPVTRMDLVVSLGLYAVASAVLGYLGFALGAGLGTAIGQGQIVAALGGAIPVVGIGYRLAIDMVLRGLVYELSDREGDVGVRVLRRGVAAWLPVPLAWTGGVVVPEPWPAALDGALDDFTVARAAVRDVEIHPHAIVIKLSANRRIQLAIRGHTQAELEPVAAHLA